jgi:hypothetical protein
MAKTATVDYAAIELAANVATHMTGEGAVSSVTVPATPATSVKLIKARVPYQLDWTVATLKANPKKVGSASYNRYAAYRVGKTVQAYLEDPRFDRRDLRADINWDLAHGFITLAPPAKA